jgi:hypothetical protein
MKDLHLVLHRQRVFYGVQALLGRAIVSRVDLAKGFPPYATIHFKESRVCLDQYVSQTLLICIIGSGTDSPK